MPIGVLDLILQLYFAVHAGRTGRYWWIFILSFFPLAGWGICFFVEYLPDNRAQSKIARSRTPNLPGNIKQLQPASSRDNKIIEIIAVLIL